MSKPIMRVHNTETNEVIDREMTDEEFAKYKLDIEANTTKANEASEKADAKAALLERLGITEDEAKLLLS